MAQEQAVGLLGSRNPFCPPVSGESSWRTQNLGKSLKDDKGFERWLMKFGGG